MFIFTICNHFSVNQLIRNLNFALKNQGILRLLNNNNDSLM